MIEIIRIPKQRLGVLIGKNGSIKKELEEKTKTHIHIEKDIEIRGEYEGVAKAEETIKAIGRGFSPEKAFLLLKEGYQLHIIYVHGNHKRVRRLLGRVIGKGGKVRKRIEEETGCFISVFGKTVSIIGNYKKIDKAIHAVELLLEGKTHGYVYNAMKNY